MADKKRIGTVVFESTDEGLPDKAAWTIQEPDNVSALGNPIDLGEVSAKPDAPLPGNWHSIDFPPDRSIDDLIAKVKELHNANRSCSSGGPECFSGLMMYYWGSPGCAYYWINGRLVWICT